MFHRRAVVSMMIACAVLGAFGNTVAQTNNACDEPGEAPDVIVGSLQAKTRWGNVGGVTGFSIGTTSCNVGTCWLNWMASNNDHPVIAQNMYRLRDGRFEQIGQSWLKHGFFALSQNYCDTGCLETLGDHLGVNCSDPYSPGSNGNQTRMGPRFEVNASTGVFPYPATDNFLSGDAIYKRLQVHDIDLDPALNPGAQYFVEGQYVTKDDAAAGNATNNASYRPVNVFDSGGLLDFNLAGATVRESPGIQAWQDSDGAVELDAVDIHDDGRILVGSRVTDLGNGTWHYEYAVQNLNSHRSVGSFSIPILDTTSLQNVGFHDVDYHSGEPIDPTDWTVTIDTSGVPAVLTWATVSHDVNPLANALRWGTLYNFRFDLDVPPDHAYLTLGLFRPGTPSSVSVHTWMPALCNDNGACDPGELACNCPGDCSAPPAEATCDDTQDDDCDGLADCADLGDCCGGPPCTTIDVDADGRGLCADCDDVNAAVWGLPGEATDLTWAVSETDGATLQWIEPGDTGGNRVVYDVLRSQDPAEFVTGVTCLVSQETTLPEPALPAPGTLFAYLIRATNACPAGTGGLGVDSAGTLRQGAACP